MTVIEKTTVHIRRRGRRKRKYQRKSPKQSDDYHDGHLKHADRTAKFTRNFQTGEFGCFCFLCFIQHSRAPPIFSVLKQETIRRK